VGDDGNLITFVVNWRDVAVYALSFGGGLLVLFVTIAAGFAKWGVGKVLDKQDETNQRIDRFERHVGNRHLGFDRRITRIEVKVGLPTPIPSDDDDTGPLRG